jgi:chemotaxis signal transduction protein
MPESLLILRHGVEILGVDLKVVREIARMMLLRRLPGAPPGVLGAMDLRGQVIPVLDLEARLPVGAARPGVDNYLVVLSLGDGEIDLAVAATRIEDIEIVSGAAFQPAQTTLPPGVPLSGVARTALGWVPVLEPASLLRPGEAMALREAVRRLTEHLSVGSDERLA